jgi:tetratricopeptide (TPR) repeat protein
MMKEVGRYSDAEAAYRLALAQAPEDGDIHLQLGHLLKLTGRTEEAVAAYRDAERLLPDGRAAAPSSPRSGSHRQRWCRPRRLATPISPTGIACGMRGIRRGGGSL